MQGIQLNIVGADEVIESFSSSLKVLGGVMLGVEYVNNFNTGINKKGMDANEAAVYSGVVTATTYAGELGISVITATAVAAVGVTGIISVAVGGIVSILVSDQIKAAVDKLYDKYAPIVKEKIQQLKQVMEDKWNQFTNWAGNLFKF